MHTHSMVPMPRPELVLAFYRVEAGFCFCCAVYSRLAGSGAPWQFPASVSHLIQDCWDYRRPLPHLAFIQDQGLNSGLRLALITPWPLNHLTGFLLSPSSLCLGIGSHYTAQTGFRLPILLCASWLQGMGLWVWAFTPASHAAFPSLFSLDRIILGWNGSLLWFHRTWLVFINLYFSDDWTKSINQRSFPTLFGFWGSNSGYQVSDRHFYMLCHFAKNPLAK